MYSSPQKYFCFSSVLLKVFLKYYLLINPPRINIGLQQFFIKLPNAWDEMHRKGYLEFLKKLDKPDHLGLEKIMLVMEKNAVKKF